MKLKLDSDRAVPMFTKWEIQKITHPVKESDSYLAYQHTTLKVNNVSENFFVSYVTNLVIIVTRNAYSEAKD